MLYSAGGRFLIRAKEFEGWRELCDRLQTSVDGWAWEEAEGDLAFHLAAVGFSGGRVPSAGLRAALVERRNQPLGFVLRESGRWREEKFFRRALPGQARCAGCAATRPLIEGGDVCARCNEDISLGQALAHSSFGRISSDPSGQISALGLSLELCERRDSSAGEWLSLAGAASDATRWPVLRQVPLSSSGDVLDFDEIADFSPGNRKFLGYARIDADHVGERFDRLGGDPKRVWGLSRLLHLFFGSYAGELLRERFPHIYAVYGGGDDLFVIGPWAEVLEYVLELRRSLRIVAGDGLTFSAGIHLTKPLEHVLSAANEAGRDLEKAKVDRAWARQTGRDQIRALDVISDWETFAKLLNEGKRASNWLEERLVPSSFLQQVLLLHRQWRSARRPADLVRHRPLLRYQAERNLKGEVRSWALSVFREDSLWPWADFVARYSLLASKRSKESED